jgi:3'-phosphoadenosine 5'-phosphosulfate sulfotransferase (PAPS reductase)/FAD synthetase
MIQENAQPATPVQHIVSTPTLWEDDAEQRVDEMIERGRKITAEAIEQYKPVAIFGGFSGGDDSIVACHFAVEQFGAAVAHVNTKTGVKQTRDHVQKLVNKYGWHLIEKHAVAQGPPKHTRKYINGKRENLPFDPSTLPTGKWQDGATAFEEFCVNFGMPGPGMHGRMYQRLKERQFNAIRRDAKRGKHKHDCIMMLTGIRQDESAIRAGYKRAVSKVGGTVWVNPFYYSNAGEFELYRQEFGLPRNPVKPIVGVSGDCLCGTFADNPEEIELAGTLDPARYADMQRIEGRCESLGLPCNWGTRPPRSQRTDDLQLTLFGDEPTFQPACVGCMRRRPSRSC